jgi:uncharacterized membrane protein YedE/YeeE
MSKEQLFGLVTGILFGVLLQRARVVRFEKQIGALLLRDLTIVKFMFTAILVGMVGIYILYDLGLVKLSIKPTLVGANIIGGLLFGTGWALCGFCPGTAGGALGEGRWHAAWVLIGMILGAAVYAELFPVLKETVLTWGNYDKITIPQALGVSHWMVIPWFLVGGMALFWFLEKRRL